MNIEMVNWRFISSLWYSDLYHIVYFFGVGTGTQCLRNLYHLIIIIFFSLFLNFFFFENLFFILPVSAIVGMSESIWSDVGVGGFCLYVTLSPGCILNVAKFLSTVKFVVLSWGS